MNIEERDYFEDLKKECQQFTGNKALFWSGKMSTIISCIERGYIINLSKNMELLFKIRTEYDNEILNRMYNNE